MNTWWEAVLELMFPGSHQCLFCYREIPGQKGNGVCDPCREQILGLSADLGACPRCGYFTKNAVCPNCADWPPVLLRSVSVAPYRGLYRELVQNLKFSSQTELAGPLGHLMACKAATLDIIRNVNIIVPVPLHPQREKERGYNQSALLAGMMGQDLSLPVKQILIRKYPSPTQTTLGRRERRANMVRVFALINDEAVRSRTVLLVDDVITTGSTLLSCAQVLIAGGARAVYGLTWAAGYDKAQKLE